VGSGEWGVGSGEWGVGGFVEDGLGLFSGMLVLCFRLNLLAVSNLCPY
jgi:hypothetical protein